MDIPGFLLITAAVVCYLLAMQWGGAVKSWRSADVIGTLVGAFVLSIIFIAVEWYQGARALLLPSILKNRTIAHGCAFSFLIAGTFYILLYYLPIYFQAVRGTTATESGIRTIPLILGLSESLKSPDLYLHRQLLAEFSTDIPSYGTNHHGYIDWRY